MAEQLSCDGKLWCAGTLVCSLSGKVFRVSMGKRSWEGMHGQALLLGSILPERGQINTGALPCTLP